MRFVTITKAAKQIDRAKHIQLELAFPISIGTYVAF